VVAGHADPAPLPRSGNHSLSARHWARRRVAQSQPRGGPSAASGLRSFAEPTVWRASPSRAGGVGPAWRFGSGRRRPSGESFTRRVDHTSVTKKRRARSSSGAAPQQHPATSSHRPSHQDRRRGLVLRIRIRAPSALASFGVHPARDISPRTSSATRGRTERSPTSASPSAPGRQSAHDMGSGGSPRLRISRPERLGRQHRVRPATRSRRRVLLFEKRWRPRAVPGDTSRSRPSLDINRGRTTCVWTTGGLAVDPAV